MMSEWTEDICPDRLAERPYKKIYACKNISTDSGHLQDFFLQKCTDKKNPACGILRLRRVA